MKCASAGVKKRSVAIKGEPAWNRGIPLSEETKRKISEALKGHPAPMKGKQFSEETKQKMSEARRGDKNPQWGKPHSEETRRKISESKKGKKIKPCSEERRQKIAAALKGKYCGSASTGWRGGVSFEPYCIKFNPEFKERVREFFGRICVECGAPEEQGYRHHVHHVNFRKDACCAEDVVPLFVPLCRSCHGKSNGNRDYWEARFTALIDKKYGGQCYLPKAGATG